MLSYTERARRRGAITGADFLASMRRVGFVEVIAGPHALHEFVHRNAPGRRFRMLMGESYSTALPRLLVELREAVAAPPVDPASRWPSPECRCEWSQRDE